MYKKQTLNYITIVLAISTIGMAIYTVKTKENIIWCTVMIILTLISNYISNRVNDKDINLTDKDKEMLKEISEAKKKSNKKR